MSKTEFIPARETAISLRSRSGQKSSLPFPDRRRTPRPRLAEIRRGGKLNLLPPLVVSGAVRMVEFLLVATLGFAIYLAYVEHEAETAHLIYLAAVLLAATANTLILQALGLYQIPAFSSFVGSYTRALFAWTIVIVGMMSLAFFGKVGADFSRVWIATWYASALIALFGERLHYPSSRIAG